jgi:hypothetical protein
MTKKYPDRWVVIQTGEIAKVLASYYGDAWQLSSGIVSTKDLGDRYEFTNVSGSVYVCHKCWQGMSMYTENLLNYWRKESGLPLEIINYEN